jgi:hypothetical protein
MTHLVPVVPVRFFVCIANAAARAEDAAASL